MTAQKTKRRNGLGENGGKVYGCGHRRKLKVTMATRKKQTTEQTDRLWQRIDEIRETRQIPMRKIVTALKLSPDAMEDIRRSRWKPPHPALASGYRPIAELLGVDWHDLQTLATQDRESIERNQKTRRKAKPVGVESDR